MVSELFPFGFTPEEISDEQERLKTEVSQHFSAGEEDDLDVMRLKVAGDPVSTAQYLRAKRLTEEDEKTK